MAKKRRKRDEPAGRASQRKGGDARSSLPSIPTWLPVVLFVGLTALLFRAFIFSDQMLFGGDTLGLGYVSRAFYADALKHLGTFPRWEPPILGGTPFLEALSGGDSLYPPSLLLLLLLEPYRALGWKLVLHIAAAGFFMFGWIRAIGASRAAALVAGCAYMLAPFLVSMVYPGHDGKIFVTALTPLLFWAVEWHFVRTRLTTFAAVAAVVALVVLTTHFQFAYFLFGSVGLYAIYRTWQERRASGDAPAEAAGAPAGAASRPLRRAPLTRFVLFLTASVLGVGIAGVQFFPAASYITTSSRRIQTTREEAQETGVAWSSSWSLHPEEAMSMLVPEFAGNNAGGQPWARNTYWGRNPFKNNLEYAGLVVVLLAAVSFFGGERRGLRRFFLALGSVAFLFALGTHTPVWRIFYALVPGIRLFRAPSQVMFLFSFGAATLAALGVDRLLELAGSDRDDAWLPILRFLWGASGALGVLALLIASGAFTDVWTSTVYRGIPPDRATALASALPYIARGAWISFLLALTTAGVAWTLRRGLLPSGAAVAGLVILVAADALRVDPAFIQVLDFHDWSAPNANMQAVLDRETGSEEPYRLLSFRQAGQDVMPALYGIELAAGHHPNDLARYRELIGMVGSGLPENLFNDKIRRLLNVRYILWPDYEMGQSVSGPIVSRLQLRDGTPYETILSEDGLPRARLVGSAVVKADSEAVPYMLSDAFDPEREVVLPETPPVALPDSAVQGAVRWLERTPNRLRLSVESDSPALLVVADNWFPAWHATVDGAEAPVLRAYHTLRAVPVPAGSSTVEMYYRSALVTWSTRISLFLALALAAAVGVQLLQDRRARSAS